MADVGMLALMEHVDQMTTIVSQRLERLIMIASSPHATYLCPG
jgi:hypothetical protein